MILVILFSSLLVGSCILYLYSFGCSIQESDLHTKRTGHNEFVDKTSETVKPISLEAPKPDDDKPMEEADSSNSCSEGVNFFMFIFYIIEFIIKGAMFPINMNNNNLGYLFILSFLLACCND